jgi:hypothetical protein
MRVRVLLLLTNAALIFAFVTPFLRNSLRGWSDGHGMM